MLTCKHQPEGDEQGHPPAEEVEEVDSLGVEPVLLVYHQKVDVHGESEGPQDRGYGREPRKKGLCCAEVVDIVAPVVVTSLAARPDQVVKVDNHSNEVGTPNAKVGDRQVDQDLPGPGPDAGDADVGEDYQESSYHGEERHGRHHDSKPDLLVLQGIGAADGRCIAGPVGD